MPNPVVPALKDWLLRHEGDVAHGINDYGDLAPVFEHLWGRPASKMKVRSAAPHEERERWVLSKDAGVLPDGVPASPGTTLYAFGPSDTTWFYDLPELPGKP